MNYSLHWLPSVLEGAGCNVVRVSGWETRGQGDMGTIRGVLCHHTAGPRSGNMPSLELVKSGRPDLPGPLSQLGLGRDGTFYVIAAGRCSHAGRGIWQGVSTGNTSFIGIEAENMGTGADPWPGIQVEAYARGVAGILQHIGAPAIMCAGHKEYALPRGRKIDPSFDMDHFREVVRARMGGHTLPLKPLIDPTSVVHAMLKLGDSGNSVLMLQRKLGLIPADGRFGPQTRIAVCQFQTRNRLAVDGMVGPATWKALGI